MAEVDKKEVARITIESREWQQPRVGSIFQVTMDDGRLKFNVVIQDVGRLPPFIDQYFSNEEAARGLMDKVMKQMEVKDLGDKDQESTAAKKRPKVGGSKI